MFLAFSRLLILFALFGTAAVGCAAAEVKTHGEHHEVCARGV